MTRAEGYSAIRFWDNTFYKAPGRGQSWDTALTYNQNRVMATFSRSFSNWDYASERVHLSPFAWVNAGPDAGPLRRRPPAGVRARAAAGDAQVGNGRRVRQLQLQRRCAGFDAAPYAGAMHAASTPGNVDGVDPTLQITSSAAGSSPPAVIEGNAHDNLAIRLVRWQDDRGRAGSPR